MNDANTSETMGKRLKRICEEKKMSQVELARRTGIDRSEINRIMNDRRPPRPDELAWIAESLEVPTDDLAEGIELSPPVRKAIAEFSETTIRRMMTIQQERDEARAERDALVGARQEEFEQQKQEYLQEAERLVHEHRQEVERRGQEHKAELEAERSRWGQERQRLERQTEEVRLRAERRLEGAEEKTAHARAWGEDIRQEALVLQREAQRLAALCMEKDRQIAQLTKKAANAETAAGIGALFGTGATIIAAIAAANSSAKRRC